MSYIEHLNEIFIAISLRILKEGFEHWCILKQNEFIYDLQTNTFAKDKELIILSKLYLSQINSF